MVEVGAFTRVSVEDAASNLSVTLRRRGIHRDAKVQVEVHPPLSEEEVAKLKGSGYLEEDADVVYYKSATDMNIGTSERTIEAQHVDVAMGIAETLASLRELESARVSVMNNFTFGNAGEYLESTALLVRQQ